MASIVKLPRGRPRKVPSTSQLSIRFDQEDYERIKEYARKMELDRPGMKVSLASVVRMIVIDFLRGTK